MALARSTAGGGGCARGRLSVRESVERFKAQSILREPLSERFLVEVDCDEAKEDLLKEEEKRRGEERLQRRY